MTPGVSLGDSYVVGQLPRPIDKVHGRVHAAFATSLVNGKVKRRFEVVSAVDGEGIYVHKIQPFRSVSSYPTPPQTHFTLPPLSIRHRQDRDVAGRNFTYAIIQERGQASRLDIQCFRDVSDTIEPEQSERNKLRLDSHAAVSSLNVVPVLSVNKAKESHDVVTIHANGDVQCFSAGLEQSLWSSQLSTGRSSEGDVSNVTENTSSPIEMIEWVDFATAKHGLLKQRSDILEAIATRGHALRLIAVIVRNVNNTYTFKLFSLRSRTAGDEVNQVRGPEQLFSVDLPSGPESTAKTSNTWALHALSGSLQKLCNGILSSYDLQRAEPVLSGTLSSQNAPMEDFVRLSEHLIIARTDQKLSVYDTKFGSMQSTQLLASSELGRAGGKKRKRSMSILDDTAPITLIGYLPRAELILALVGENLVVTDVKSNRLVRAKVKAHDDALIVSIGKGVQTGAINKYANHEEAMPSILGEPLHSVSTRGEQKGAWRMSMEDFDDLIAAGNPTQFDKLFAREVGYKSAISKVEVDAKDKKKKATANPLTGIDLDADADDAIAQWTPQENLRLYSSSIFRTKALYALSRVFKLLPAQSDALTGGDNMSSLAVVFFPPNTFQWLIETGHLSQASISQAMLTHDAFRAASGPLGPGKMISALVEFDSSLRVLYSVLDSHRHLEITDICQALKSIIQSLDGTVPPQPNPNLIDDINPNTEPTTQSINGELSHNDSNLELLETDAAMDDLDYAMTTLEEGLPIRRESLSTALTKLNAFGAKVVTHCLQRMLSQDDLVYLIHILRSELAHGGWTTRYMDVESRSQANGGRGDAAEELSDHAIAVIAKILCCTVDAIGISGWLAASSSSPLVAADDLLYKLRGEISAALEGVHEAAFLTGLVGEFLRYSTRRDKNEDPTSTAKGQGAGEKAQSKSFQRKIVNRESDKPEGEASALPLGLKVRERIDPIKTLGGTGIVRDKTMRERGQEISLRTEKYQFERVRFPERAVRRKQTKLSETADGSASRKNKAREAKEPEVSSKKRRGSAVAMGKHKVHV